MQFKGDPRWLNARRRDVCEKCHREIKPGEHIFYYPETRRAYCEDCGDAESRVFDAAAQDELIYNGGSY